MALSIQAAAVLPTEGAQGVGAAETILPEVEIVVLLLRSTTVAGVAEEAMRTGAAVILIHFNE